MSYIDLLKRYPRALSFGLMSAFFSNPGQTHFIALFSPYLIAKFSLTNTEYGSLYAGATLLSGILLPFIGPLIDKKDIRYFAFCVGVGLVFSEILLFSSTNLYLLFLSLFGLRLFGQGLCSHITAVGTARYFTQNRGKALALALLGFSLGEGTLTPILAQLLQHYPWQWVSGGVAAGVALIFLPATLWLTKKNRAYNDPSFTPVVAYGQKASPPKSNQRQWTRKDVFTHRSVYILILLAMMPPFALTGIFFHQTAIGQMKGWPLTKMAAGFVFFALTRFSLGFVGGPLVDRFRAVRVFPWTSLPLALGFWVLGFFSAPWTPFFAFALFGISVGIGSSAKGSLWPELYGTQYLGAIKSSLAMVMVFSTAISPILFGFILDTQGEAQTLLYGLSASTILFSILIFYHLKWGAGSRILNPRPQ